MRWAHAIKLAIVTLNRKTGAILLIAVLNCAKGAEPEIASKRPLVGAIRWDAWHGDKGMAGQAVTRALSPQRYHFRLPFFARLISPNEAAIKGCSQAIVDEEIRYASPAGID